MYVKNLQRLRLAKGLSQEELARRIDVSVKSVARWESGSPCTKLANLIAIKNALELEGLAELGELEPGSADVYNEQVPFEVLFGFAEQAGIQSLSDMRAAERAAREHLHALHGLTAEALVGFFSDWLRARSVADGRKLPTAHERDAEHLKAERRDQGDKEVEAKGLMPIQPHVKAKTPAADPPSTVRRRADTTESKPGPPAKGAKRR